MSLCLLSNQNVQRSLKKLTSCVSEAYIIWVKVEKAVGDNFKYMTSRPQGK